MILCIENFNVILWIIWQFSKILFNIYIFSKSLTPPVAYLMSIIVIIISVVFSAPLFIFTKLELFFEDASYCYEVIFLSSYLPIVEDEWNLHAIYETLKIVLCVQKKQYIFLRKRSLHYRNYSLKISILLHIRKCFNPNIKGGSRLQAKKNVRKQTPTKVGEKREF